MQKNYFFILFMIFITLRCYSNDGDLDTTFGTGGLVQTEFSVASNSEAHAVVIQLNQKIVAAGFTDAGGFALARYETNGTLDATFGTAGLVITGFGGTADQANALVLQSDQKLVAVGSTDVTGNNNFALARYNTNGTLDTTFGTGGLVNTNFGGASIDQANGAALQTDSKIIAVGVTNVTGNNNFALARYNTNGSLDTTFGTSGLVNTNFGGTSSDTANGVALQTDGKIVAAGVTNVTGNNNFALARYNTDGSLDTTFGTGGLVNTNFGGTASDQAIAVALQTDGKIVAVGVTTLGGTNQFAIARYTTSGSLDTTFNGTGLVTTSFGGLGDIARAVVISGDKIIVAGSSLSGGGNSRFALARYNDNGSLDITFGIAGLVVTQFPASTADIVFGLALQDDSKIIAAGLSQIAGVFFGFGLARYLNCPTLVGSDSVLQVFDAQQSVGGNGRIAKLALLQGGFDLCGDATFDSLLPVVGDVCLNCYTLTLEQDLIMHNVSSIGSLGSIIGNDHVLSLAKSSTILPSFVCTGTFCTL